MKAKSLWHLALQEELSDIIQSEIGQTVLTENNYGDDNGNLYFPLASHELHDQAPKFEDVTSTRRNEIGFLREMLDRNVKTIAYDQDQGFNLEAFLSQLCTLNEVYGVLLKDANNSEYMINPLHPLTALAIKLGQVKLPVKGKLIVYNWKDSILRDHGVSHDTRYKATMEAKWMEFIGQSKNFIGKKVSERRLTINKDDYLEQLSGFDSLKQLSLFGDINYREMNEVADIKMLLIPLQMAVGSIATPFYGVSYINNPTNSPRGFNTGYMISGNLKSSYDSNGGDVCTGSLSNTRDTGWLTLNRINLDSMWYGQIVSTSQSDLIDFAYTAKYIASQFYKIAEPEEEATDNTEQSVEDRISEGRD